MKTFTGWQYLLIDLANQFGHDKLVFEERIQWAQDNLSNLEALAEQGIAHGRDHGGAGATEGTDLSPGCANLPWVVAIQVYCGARHGCCIQTWLATWRQGIKLPTICHQNDTPPTKTPSPCLSLLSGWV
jgi:hypothetical protein